MEQILRTRIWAGRSGPILLALLTGLLWTGPVSAESRLKFSATASANLRPDLVLGLSLGTRLVPESGLIDRRYAGVSLDQSLGDGVAAGLEYEHVRHGVADSPGYDGHRLAQQLSYGLARMGRVQLSARTRMQQRLNGGDAANSYRLQQRLGLSLPLVEGVQFGLSADAVFLLQRSGASKAGLYQFRNRARLSVPLMDGLKMGVEYEHRPGFVGQTANRHSLGLGLSAEF